MSDDATARWLDEQLDLALAQGGTLPPELADTELGEVIQLFAADAATNDAMSDASGVRRRLLEQIGDEQQAAEGAGFVGSLLRGTGRGAGMGARGAGWSAGRAWRARRVVMVAGCMVVLCTTLAYADTSTPAGRIVRTAARTLQIPVPAEPKSAAERREDKQAREDKQGASGDDRRDGERAGGEGNDPNAQRDPAMVLPGEPGEDGMFEPGEQPLPPEGDRVFDGSGPRPEGEMDGQQLPPDDGATQPMPNPDGSIPPPTGEPKPPIGQQPPPGGTAPAPCCQRPPAPKPGGTAPAPTGTAPATQPPPLQPAPQPQPAPAPQPAP